MTSSKVEKASNKQLRNPYFLRDSYAEKVKVVTATFTFFVALLSSLLLLSRPVDTTSTLYKWDPISASDSGVFPLDRSWPQYLDITFINYCENEIKRRVVSLGGMEVVCNSGKIEVTSGTKSISFALAAIGDTVSVKFEADKSKLTVTNQATNSFETSILNYQDFPKVTQLDAPSPAGDKLELSLETRPDSIIFDPARISLLLITLFFSFLTAWLISNKQPISQSEQSLFRFKSQSIFVGFGLVISAFTVPMFYDDGWVIQRVNQYLHTGYFGDFFFHSNAWLPQSYLTESFVSFLLSAGLPYIGLRLFVALVLFVTWLLCLKSVLILTRKISQSQLWFSSAVFLSIAGVWSISLRAESWVSLFLAAQLLFIVRYSKSGNYSDFYFSGLFAALAISTHQSGMLAIIGALGIAYLGIKNCNRNSLLKLALTTFSILALFLAFFFAGYDFASIESSVKDFTDGAYENRLNEFNRIGEIAGAAISSARKFGWLLAVVVFAFTLINYHRIPKPYKFIVTLLLCYPLGLLLTSSKWGWHFGVMAVPTFLVLLVVLISIKEKETNLNVRYSILFPVLTLCAGISLASKGSWGTYDYRWISWEDFSEFFAGTTSNYFWYVAAILLFILGNLLDRTKSKYAKRSGGIFLVVLVLIPYIFSISWIVIDSFAEVKPGVNTWTVFRQNIKTAFAINPESCGILGSVPAFDSQIQQLDQSEIPVDALMLTKSEAELFGWSNVISWDSSSGNNFIQSTPTYTLPSSDLPLQHISTWWTVSDGYPAEEVFLTVTYLFNDGQSIPETFGLPVPDVGGVWSEFKIPIPDGVSRLSLQTYGNEYAFVKITEPLLVTESNAKTTLGSGTTFIAPSFLPAVPCAQLPVAENGLFPFPTFVISQNYNLDTRMWIEQYFPPGRMMITDVGRVEENTPSIWRIKFDVATRVTALSGKIESD